MKRLLLALLVALLPTQAFPQASIQQGGSWSAGLLPTYSAAGGSSQPIVQSAGTASGVGVGARELAIISRGSGTAPFVGQGGGYLGSTFCLYDGPITASAGYHQLCLGTNVTGNKGLISYNAGGGAASQGFNFVLNGTTYEFPFSTSGVIGPATTVVNDLACWNNTTGTLLKDCGAPLSVGGSNGQIQYNNSGALGGFTMSGDATIVPSTGVITVAKIGNVAVSLGGALTTGGAFTTSGASALTLTTSGVTNVSLPATGTLATLAGSEALTNKTYNGNTWTSGTGTLTIGAGKTLTASNTLTFAGTDASTLNIGSGGTLGTAAYTATTAYVPSNTQITNSLSADVLLNNTANYFLGPTVAQGSSGTWYASGTVSLIDTSGSANFYCKLWDGTTVIASAVGSTAGSGVLAAVSLSGYLATPAGNIRISCRDPTSTSGSLIFNTSGNSKDSTLTAFRVN